MPSDAELRDKYEKKAGYSLKWNGGSFLAKVENAIERAITASTIEVQAKTRLELNRTAGPTTMVPDRPSSKPGEVPHKRTGTLGASIDYETFRAHRTGVLSSGGRGDFYGRVGTNLKYGKYLELGTRGGTVIYPKRGKYLTWKGPDGKWHRATRVVTQPMEPRPFLRPALDAMRPKIVQRIADAGKRMK